MSETITYTTTSCETLQSIADRFGTTPAKLYLANADQAFHPQGVTLPVGQDRYVAPERTDLAQVARALLSNETALRCHFPALPAVMTHDDSHAWYYLTKAFTFTAAPEIPPTPETVSLEIAAKKGDSLLRIAEQQQIEPGLFREILGAYGIDIEEHLGDSGFTYAFAEDVAFSTTFDLAPPTGFLDAGREIIIPRS